MARDTSAYPDGWLSVTEILSINGLSSFDHVPPAVLERARDRGHDVHAWLHAIDAGIVERAEEPPEVIAAYVRAYLRFLDETGATVLKSEEVVRHEGLRYVGTLDRLMVVAGRETVVDLKAVASLQPATALQTMGYALALGGRPARAALWLRADGTYRFVKYQDRADEADWISAVRMAHWRLARGLVRLEDLA